MQSCKYDDDCPVGQPFDVWFKGALKTVENTRQFASDGKMRVNDFLKHVDAQSSIEGLPTSVKSTSSRLIKRDLKTELGQLYETNAQFRTTVDKMAAEEERVEFWQARSEDQRMACQMKDERRVCVRNGQAMTTTPTTRIYDGRGSAVAFTQNMDDAHSLLYTHGEVTRSVSAVRCDGTDLAACTDPDIVEVRGERPTLASEQVRDHYRVKFQRSGANDATYIVQNKLQAYGMPGSHADTCATKLCERNADACPAPHCRVDGKACVPA